MRSLFTGWFWECFGPELWRLWRKPWWSTVKTVSKYEGKGGEDGQQQCGRAGGGRDEGAEVLFGRNEDRWDQEWGGQRGSTCVTLGGEDCMRDLHLMGYLSAIFIKYWNKRYPLGWFALLWLMQKVLHTFTSMFSKAWHERLSFGLQMKAPIESWSCLSERVRMFCRPVAWLLELRLYERGWKQAERSFVSPWRRPADWRLTFLDFPSNNRLLGLHEAEHRATGTMTRSLFHIPSHLIPWKRNCFAEMFQQSMNSGYNSFCFRLNHPHLPKHTFIYVLK